MSAVTMLLLGIVALQYRTEAVAATNPSGNALEAFNLTSAVGGDGLAIVGNAMPQLLGFAIVVVVAMLLLMISGR